VEHRRDLASQQLASPVGETELALLDVPGHGGQAIVSRQARSGLIVVFGAHERENVAIAALQKARQNLRSHESRGAGEEHGAHVIRLSREAGG
jgi:hypothetical protein